MAHYRKVHVNGLEYRYVWGKKFLKVKDLPPVNKDFLRIFHYCEDEDTIYGEYSPQLVVDFIEDYNRTGIIPSDYRQSYLRDKVDWHDVLRDRHSSNQSWDD